MTPHEFTLYDLLRSTLERDPCKVAIVDGDVEYTYEDLHRLSNALQPMSKIFDPDAIIGQ